MNKKDWNEGLNNIDPALVEEHIEEMEKIAAKSCKKPVMWTRYISVAAAVCLVFVVLAVSLILNRSDDEPITIPETEAESTTEADTENAPNTEEEPTQTEAPSETVGGVVTEVTSEDVIETVATEEETTEEETTAEEDTTTFTPPPPSPMIALESFDEIIEFISLCNSSEVELKEYIDFHYPADKYPYVTPSERLFTYEHAQEMYRNVLAASIILPKEGIICDDYGIAYYPDEDILIESFLIEGRIRYQFMYFYTETFRNTEVFEGNPAFTNVPFGDTTIDLYLDGTSYRGYTTINGVTVRVSLAALESTVSFDDFDFSFNIAEYLEAYNTTE